jgi:hypothetical protein
LCEPQASVSYISLLWTKALVALGLDGTKISDDAVPHLHALSLPGLHLSNTGLTDTGLARLTGCKQLTEVQVLNTKVAADGVKKFAAAMPQCKIVSDHGTIEPKKLPCRKSARNSGRAGPGLLASAPR